MLVKKYASGIKSKRAALFYALKKNIDIEKTL